MAARHVFDPSEQGWHFDFAARLMHTPRGGCVGETADKGNTTGDVTWSLTAGAFQSAVLTGATTPRNMILATSSLRGRMTLSVWNNAGGSRTLTLRNLSAGGTSLLSVAVATGSTLIVDAVYNGSAWVITGSQTYTGDQRAATEDEK